MEAAAERSAANLQVRDSRAPSPAYLGSGYSFDAQHQEVHDRHFQDIRQRGRFLWQRQQMTSLREPLLQLRRPGRFNGHSDTSLSRWNTPPTLNL